MVKKREGSFAKASAKAKTAGDKLSDGAPDILGSRLQAVTKSRQTVPTTVRLVDPEECQIWERHNRNFERLEQGVCQDLIDSMIAQGKQEVPAIVRRTGRHSNPKYEIICGARRFWTVTWLRENNYPQFQYLIEVRTLTDEEAFRLSNLENLDRQDISDFERAQDYKQAVKLYYDGKQSVMAERNNKSESWVSRYLKLAELPQDIVDAYANLSDLKIHHGLQLLKLVENKHARGLVLDQAKVLKSQHAEARIAGQPSLKGAAVLKLLLGSAQQKKNKRGGPLSEYDAGDLKGVLIVKSKNQRSITLSVNTTLGASAANLVKAFESALIDYYK